MKKLILASFFMIFSAQLFGQLSVKEYTLSNGLRVWLNEDHSQPKVIGAVIVNAGAKDTPETGIAHYLEHLMFKGTDKIGTINYVAEKVLLDSISAQYDLLAQTVDPTQRRTIQMTINSMSVRAAKYAIPNEYSRLVARYGGSDLNAYTSLDQTVYHNSFAPSYFEHWAQLASDRMLNPVFRLFQSELETVYEEKNMYDNMFSRRAIDAAQERFFAPHPYAYPVIGTAENLKNPQLSQMEAFYKNYYVASNMGLIISGDFDAKSILPILERTFSRIPAGKATFVDMAAPVPFFGVEKTKIKIPIPIVKAAGIAWRAPGDTDFDKNVMDIIAGILCNTNQTGLIDNYVLDGKLIVGLSVNMTMKDAGAFTVIAAPKVPFGTESGAGKIIKEQVERVKSGDFSDELFESVKLETRRNAERTIEGLTDRSRLLMYLFTCAVTLDDYLDNLKKLDKLTKQELVAVANRYLTDNYLYMTKKTGKYPSQIVPKPGFTPVVSPNSEARSQYAVQMDKMPVKQAEPRFVDFKTDAVRKSISPLATLYVNKNSINDIFSLKINYWRGEREDRNLRQAAYYLQFIGTDSLTFDKLRGQLQDLGAKLSFTSSRTAFTVEISGFNANFDRTLTLVEDFMKHAAPDEKQMKKVVDNERVERKAMRESNDDISFALYEKMSYGDSSIYLMHNSMQKVSKLKATDMILSLREAMKAECDIHYFGSLTLQEVVVKVESLVNPDILRTPANNSTYRQTLPLSSPKVYFVDRPKSTQAIVRAVIPSSVNASPAERHEATFFTSYIGGNMSSILFQEIREFRSFAYGVSGRYILPSMLDKDKPCYMAVAMSTQNDKTVDAINVLDSLLNNMPIKPERIQDVKQQIINNINNTYPEPRSVSSRIAVSQRNGNNEDQNIALVEYLPQMTMQIIEDFWTRNVKGRTTVYMVVGDRKKIKMDALARFGEIEFIKTNELFD